MVLHFYNIGKTIETFYVIFCPEFRFFILGLKILILL